MLRLPQFDPGPEPQPPLVKRMRKLAQAVATDRERQELLTGLGMTKNWPASEMRWRLMRNCLLAAHSCRLGFVFELRLVPSTLETGWPPDINWPVQ